MEVAFAIAGGASLHLIHSLAGTGAIKVICPQHEQAGAMAADGYARASGRIGVAVATSGPGATNLLTGVCGAYYDSVPLLLLTGQVATFRSCTGTGVRQIGFQETPTTEIFKSVTKYCALLTDPSRVRFELEEALFVARSGRPGPVLLDIPDDVQRMDVDADDLEPYVAPAAESESNLAGAVDQCLEMIDGSSRPICILGWGVHSADAENAAIEWIDRLGIPVAPTWAAADILPHEHPLYAGTFGTHGTRYGNFAVQNADLMISIGSRLDTKATGSPPSSFARGARKIVVDIDPCELAKFAPSGVHIDLPILADVRDFLDQANARTREPRRGAKFAAWVKQIHSWKSRYPQCLASYYDEGQTNPYVFVRELSRRTPTNAMVLTDTGCAVAWMLQGFEVKEGQRVFHDFNNTAMGWALPASIGASLADASVPVVCIMGDGSLQMTVHELATVVRHGLPIKIFLLNNRGYSMIRQTQDQWMSSEYIASSFEGGLALPDFGAIASAYGFECRAISDNADVSAGIAEVLAQEGPVFCEVAISPNHRVVPQVRFGRPNEDAEPYLERREFLENMLVEPLPISVTE